MSLLNNADFMKFPFTILSAGVKNSSRREHVREQIEQVLFTNPGERWFRPEFGLGVNALVFEPNNNALWEVTKKRLLSSLNDTLTGEVSPASLQVDVIGGNEKLLITVAYTLATINQSEKLEFSVSGNF